MKSSSAISSLFDSIASSYTNKFITDVVERKKLEKLIELWQIKCGMKICEVGSGTGDLTPFLVREAGNAGNIICVEESGEMLKAARNKLQKISGHINFINGDFVDVPLTPCSFDRVIFFNSFPHVVHKQEALLKAGTVLKTSGIVIISHNKCRQAINAIHTRKHIPSSLSYFPDRNEMEKLFRQSGLALDLYVDDSKEDYYVLKARKGA